MCWISLITRGQLFVTPLSSPTANLVENSPPLGIIKNFKWCFSVGMRRGKYARCSILSKNLKIRILHQFWQHD